MDWNKNDFYISEEDLTGKPSKEDRILAALCYMHFLFIVPFLMQKDSDFLKFHMSQWGVLYVLLIVVSTLAWAILLISWSFRMMWFSILAFVAYTILWVFVWYKAYQWKKYEIWFLKQIVEKIKKILDENEGKKDDDEQNYY